MIAPFLFMLAVPLPETGAFDPLTAAPVLAARIDQLTEAHWQANAVKPAALVDDAAFLRRLTLDLAGRIPTLGEAKAFAEDRASDKRARAVRRLMESPEYALHMGRVLDEMIQGKYAGDGEFIEYLRRAIAQRRPWHRMFRDMMLGPWDDQRKGADRFLARRLNSLDDLTNDTARIFFGVNVSCAKCHDHPLVSDWTQDHYYGMASFFNPTYEGSKGRGKAGGSVTEKTVGPVQFTTTKGERRTAKTMFLSNRVVEDAKPQVTAAKPQATPGRREQLVQVALEEKGFFSKAIVNKLWAYFLGRGLVAPVDQMHSANPPAIPGLLEWLADDLAAHGYALDRLVAGIVSSKVYQLASAPTEGSEPPGEKLFAQGMLRPLTPPQYAVSLILATSDAGLEGIADPAARGKRYRELEAAAGVFARPGLLDPRGERFQSSAGEALYLSNHADVQKLLAPTGNNLAARLVAITDTGAMIDAAYWTVLSRPPGPGERTYLTKFLDDRAADRAKATGQMLWALLTSAEFRFNH
jgi:hypothetical protein